MTAPIRADALIRSVTQRMTGAGVASPRVDAELLLCYVLGVPRSRLPLVADVPDDALERFLDLVERRVRREPLQHLLGTAPFRHLELAVGPGVFVPRPETELLVDAVLPHLATRSRPVAVDLCAGSGALALAVAAEAPAVSVTAVERSPDALVWLRRNLAAIGVGSRVRVVEADVSAPGDALTELAGEADAVISNPPYVPTTVPVGPEVGHDPAEAVFAGPAGLDLIPAVIALAGQLLRAGGVLAMEHDESHAGAVRELFDDRWHDVVSHPDLSGRDRYVTAWRN